MVLGGHSRKIIVRGQEYRWVASGNHNGCSWKECRQLTLAIEKRLHPAHSCRTGKGRKSHSAHPSRRRSILLTVTIGYQLPYLGSFPTPPRHRGPHAPSGFSITLPHCPLPSF